MGLTCRKIWGKNAKGGSKLYDSECLPVLRRRTSQQWLRCRFCAQTMSAFWQRKSRGWELSAARHLLSLERRQTHWWDRLHRLLPAGHYWSGETWNADFPTMRGMSSIMIRRYRAKKASKVQLTWQRWRHSQTSPSTRQAFAHSCWVQSSNKKWTPKIGCSEYTWCPRRGEKRLQRLELSQPLWRRHHCWHRKRWHSFFLPPYVCQCLKGMVTKNVASHYEVCYFGLKKEMVTKKQRTITNWG